MTEKKRAHELVAKPASVEDATLELLQDTEECEEVRER